jgi:hypothetical protein
VTAAGARAVVKLRWSRGVFTSDLVPAAEAIERAAWLKAAVLDCRDGVAFVGFAAAGGRLVEVRGREVVAIEVVPERELRDAAPARTGTVAVTGGVTYPPSGTGWLREQSMAQWSGR